MNGIFFNPKAEFMLLNGAIVNVCSSSVEHSLLFYRPLTNGSKLGTTGEEGAALSGTGGATRVLMTISLMKDLCVLKQWNGYKMFGGLSFSV